MFIIKKKLKYVFRLCGAFEGFVNSKPWTHWTRTTTTAHIVCLFAFCALPITCAIKAHWWYTYTHNYRSTFYMQSLHVMLWTKYRLLFKILWVCVWVCLYLKQNTLKDVCTLCIQSTNLRFSCARSLGYLYLYLCIHELNKQRDCVIIYKIEIYLRTNL